MVYALSILYALALLHGIPLFIGLGALGALYQLSNVLQDQAGTFGEVMQQLTVIFVDPQGKLTSSDLFLTIPYFTFAGYLIAHSKFAERVIGVTLWLMSKIGSAGLATLGIASVLIAALFTPLTGASGVTIVAIGGILFPILIRTGYSEKQALGLITASGSIGLLFEPSLPVMLFGIISENRADIHDLYRAGRLPGLVLILSLACYIIFMSWQKRKSVGLSSVLTQASDGAIPRITRSGVLKLIPELLALPILIQLMKTRFVSITELGAIFLLYFLILETIIYREMNFQKLFKVFEEAVAMMGSIIVIIFFAMILTNALLYDQVPQKLFTFIKQYISSPITFLVLLNFFLLIVGALMDIFSAIIVVAPLILPIAESYGIHSVHLGILFLTNLEIGYLTPPVGLNLFLSSLRFKKPLSEVYRSIVPYLIILIIAQLVITYIPYLSLWWLPTENGARN